MKRFTSSLIILLLAISCVNSIPGEGSEEVPGDVPVNFSARIVQTFTRMTGDAFEVGDRIGVYALTPIGSLEGSRYADNLLMTYQSGGSLLAQKPLYYPEGDVSLDIFAYFPYQSSGIPAGSSLLPVSVKADQSSDANFEASDFLTATSTSSAEGGTVALNFRHKGVKVAINLKPSEGLTLDELKVANPRLVGTNFYTEGDYNPADDTFTNLASGRDIVAHGTWAKSETDGMLTGKEFIVLPQGIGVLERSVSLELNGKLLNCQITQETLTSGKKYTYNVYVNSTGTGIVDVTGSVTDWDDTGSTDTETTTTGHAVHTSVFSFHDSNAYRVYYQGKPVAEVWREYLRNGTEAFQALVAYPMKDGEHCDLQNGLLLKRYDSEEAVCGGKVSWNADGLGYTYTGGTLPAIETFYIGSDYGLRTENTGNTLEVSVGQQTLKDYRSATVKEYSVTKIGTQIWMARDLRATAFADGTALPRQTDPGNVGYYQVEGKEVYFYNAETLKAGEMAPEGWRIATDADWAQLKAYIGDDVSVLKSDKWEAYTAGKEVAPVTNLAWFYAYSLGMWMGKHVSGSKLAAYWSWDTTTDEPSEELVVLLGEASGFYTGVHAYDTDLKAYKAVSIRCVQK